MAKQFLHGGDRGALADEVGGQDPPEGVGVGADAGEAGQLVDEAVDTAGAQGPAAEAEEEGALVVVLGVEEDVAALVDVAGEWGSEAGGRGTTRLWPRLTRRRRRVPDFLRGPTSPPG